FGLGAAYQRWEELERADDEALKSHRMENPALLIEMQGEFGEHWKFENQTLLKFWEKPLNVNLKNQLYYEFTSWGLTVGPNIDLFYSDGNYRDRMTIEAGVLMGIRW
ncbi:MAG: hypothetical protein KDD22_06585, partial [Bdellovibrionales bacterium]|nr:hypothetical protein [Bdellovibrionales bacterium]